LALVGGKLRVLGLRDGGAKHIQTADVLVLRSDAVKRFIEALRISTREMRNAAHAKNFKVAQHGGAH